MKSTFSLFLPLAALFSCTEVSPPLSEAPLPSELPIVPRAGWSLVEPDLEALEKMPMGKICYISIHQTETPVPDKVDEVSRLRSVQGWHQTNAEGPRFGDIAYHYLIGPSGKIYEGRSEKYASSSGTVYLTPVEWQAAPQDDNGGTTAPLPEGVSKPGASAGHLTICLIGTFHKELPTAQALDSATRLVATKLREYDLGLDAVMMHREIACYTDCPGQALYDYFRGQARTRGAAGEGLQLIRKKLAK